MINVPKHILIIQTGTVADVVLTTPLAMALRARLPRAKLTWGVRGAAQSVCQQSEVADHTLIMPDFDGWTRSWHEARQQCRWIATGHYDWVLHPETRSLGGVSNRWPLPNLEPWKLVFSRSLKRCPPIARTRLMTRSRDWHGPDDVTAVMPHFVDRQLELLTPVDAHVVTASWPSFATPAAEQWARNICCAVADHPVLLMHVGAETEADCWHADRFAATARYARDRYHFRTLVSWTTFEDRLRAERVVAMSQSAAELVPPTNLSAMAALASIVDVVVAGDCVPLHLAVAAKTPTIALFGETDPRWLGPHQRETLRGTSRPHSPAMTKQFSRADNSIDAVTVRHACQALDQTVASSPALSERAA